MTGGRGGFLETIVLIPGPWALCLQKMGISRLWVTTRGWAIALL